MVQGEKRNPAKPLWSPFFFTRPRCCWAKVNMRFVGESFSIYNTLKDEEFCSCWSFDRLIDLLFSSHPSPFKRAAESICSISLLLVAISLWETKFQITFWRSTPRFCQQSRSPSTTCERKTAQSFSLLPSLRVDRIIRSHQLMTVGKVFSVCYFLTSSAE